jgi:hypothetical protein
LEVLTALPTRLSDEMGDRSKVEKGTVRCIAEEKNATAAVLRCRHCRKSSREVRAMVELGGFVFCDSCIETAASIIGMRKAD